MNTKEMIAAGAAAVMLMFSPTATAHPVRTPEGNMPMIHWTVVESTPGNMSEMGKIASETVGSVSTAESGTYTLYGGIDAENHDVMRLLEIYESYEAYRIHVSSEAFSEYRARRLPILKNLKLIEVDGIALEQKNKGVGTIIVI